MRFLLIAALLTVAGCSTAEPAPPPVTAAPATVVDYWLTAVAGSDVEALEELVEPIGLVVLAGAENQVRSDEMAALLDVGLRGDLSRGYWQSFRDDVIAIRGVAIEEISVAGEATKELGIGFAGVEVAAADANGVVFVKRSEEVGWQVDMIATVGSRLVGPLADYLESALVGENADTIAEAYRVAVVPGLDAAIALDPDSADLVFGAEAIRLMLRDRPESSG